MTRNLSSACFTTLRIALPVALGILAVVLIALWLIPELDSEVMALRRLKPPVVVSETVLFYDGGSVGLTLTGANGNTLKCGVNGSSIYDENRNLANPHHGHVCFYAHHSTQEQAVMVPPGGLAERRLLGILRSWLSKSIGMPQQPETSEKEIYPELVEAFLKSCSPATRRAFSHGSPAR